MRGNTRSETLEPWVSELSFIENAQDRRCLLARQCPVRDKETFEKLYQGAVFLLRVDVERAARLAEAGAWVATELNDPSVTAKSARALGHVIALNGDYWKAIEEYDRSRAGFEKAGDDLEAALSISGIMQPLIYTGQYERAFQLADKARATFSALGDALRLTRLDSNLANIYYRQDRFDDAVQLYERAYKSFLQHGDPLDIAIVLRNLAVCYISLNEFAKAEETYRMAKKHCEDHGFSELIIKADYNVAYLYYLRGEYLRAIEMYDQTRLLCKQLGNRYHAALCDLDQSEIHLELNLTEGAKELAQNASATFIELGMAYEAAKAATFSAIASSLQGHHKSALRVFDQARELFVKEGNHLWPALIDLYKAFALYQFGQTEDAEDLAGSALHLLAPSVSPAKAALCELLLAAIELQDSDTEAARRFCASAMSRLAQVESPALYQAHLLLGQVEERAGNKELARQSYQNAFDQLESLRSNLGREELKIAFLQNKSAVYEGLVINSMASGCDEQTTQEAFHFVERAKSRSLADLIAFGAGSISGRTPEASALMGKFRDLNQKLNWTYHEIELEELNPEARSAERVQRLRQQSWRYENELVKSFSQLQSVDQEYASLQSAKTISVAELQGVLPADSMVVEYYAARNRFYVCLVSREKFSILPVADVRSVREKLRLLQLQLSKFRFGDEHTLPLRDPIRKATQAHLEELYSLLILPFRDQLTTKHLVVVPHGFLHYLPFHALSDGKRHLIDDYSISYAPSGTVFAACQGSPQVAVGSGALVLAVPDARASHIEEEVRSVAEAMDNAKLFIGDEATEERLREFGPKSRFIHIATHGHFRQDNPMFSSIRLGNSLLSLFDLYQLRFNAELVTLSGCGTGLSVVVGGDELIGLVRGLLYAGAKTLIVSLWEVNDRSTAEFMQNFYVEYKQSGQKVNALRKAMITLKEKYSDPYYWAAFAMVGRT
jgi:CHAT domain-containing protein